MVLFPNRIVRRCWIQRGNLKNSKTRILIISGCLFVFLVRWQKIPKFQPDFSCIEMAFV